MLTFSHGRFRRKANMSEALRIGPRCCDVIDTADAVLRQQKMGGKRIPQSMRCCHLMNRRFFYCSLECAGTWDRTYDCDGLPLNSGFGKTQIQRLVVNAGLYLHGTILAAREATQRGCGTSIVAERYIYLA